MPAKRIFTSIPYAKTAVGSFYQAERADKNIQTATGKDLGLNVL
jgi:hypothetical protein